MGSHLKRPMREEGGGNSTEIGKDCMKKRISSEKGGKGAGGGAKKGGVQWP